MTVVWGAGCQELTKKQKAENAAYKKARDAKNKADQKLRQADAVFIKLGSTKTKK